jgi:AAA+ ATPase superfamily predicted ATPase
MEKKVLNIKSPLYGRRTAQWNLEAIPFKHINEFLPKTNLIDQYKFYFVFGGVPAYLQKLDQNSSFEENIIEQIFTKGNFLNQEGNLLLNYEFTESANYKLILSAISQGHQKQKEIVEFTHLDYSLVSKYLFVLKSLSIIIEEIPITESKRFKGRLYKIKDNYLQFWFRYLFSDLSYIESHEPNEIFNFYKKDIEVYFGFKFEDVIKELFLSYQIPTKNK